MSEQPAQVVGNINDVRDMPWPTFARLAFYEERVAQERAAAFARAVGHTAAAESERSLARAAEVWYGHESLQRAGWYAFPGEAVPEDDEPCWIILRHRLVSPSTAYLSYYTQEDGWYNVDEGRVAYWYPCTLPPGPVKIGYE